MRFIDPRTQEDKKNWAQRGPNIVRRPGEVRALIWRMLPWYVTAFFAAITAGSILNSFWVSAILALFFMVFSPSPIRRRVRIGERAPLYDHRSTVGVAIVALVTTGLVCEWELQNRINEFESRRIHILAQAKLALESGEHSTIYSLVERYSIMPSRPLESFVAKAQILEEEAYQDSLEAYGERALERYRRQRDSQSSEVESNSAGEQ